MSAKNGNNFKSRLLVVLVALTLVVSALGAGGGLIAAEERRIDIYSALRAFGIGYVVDLFSDEINQLINALTLRTTAESKQATKVVPIISAGTGAYVGAAQVSGAESQLTRVRAVGQIEGDFFEGAIRAKALVPIDNLNPLEGLRRVRGVGVLAVIDYNVETVVDEPTPSPQPDPGPQPPVIEPPAPPSDDWPPRAPIRFNGREYPALRYLIFAEDGISIRGNANSFNGDLRSNEEIEISGNRNRVNGRRIAGSSRLKLPHFSSRDWRSRADRVYDGSLSVRDITVRGITFVDGDLVVRGDVRGEGLLVVDGDVELNGKRVAEYVTIFADGDISIRSSNVSVRAALISAGGSVHINGTRIRLHGLIAAERVSIRGNNSTYEYDTKVLDD